MTALLVVFATGLLPVSAQNDATNRPPIQTFYLPIPEEDLLQTLTSIHGFFKIRVDNLANEVR